MNFSERPGHAALRRGRIATTGHAYLVTTVIRGREPIFADVRAAQAVARMHAECNAFLDATVMCWVWIFYSALHRL